jgi:hypothetical protein
MPRLLVVLAGSGDVANRTTGSEPCCDRPPEPVTAVPGGDECEEDWDEVPVEDLLRLCNMVPPEMFELMINCDDWG